MASLGHVAAKGKITIMVNSCLCSLLQNIKITLKIQLLAPLITYSIHFRVTYVKSVAWATDFRLISQFQSICVISVFFFIKWSMISSLVQRMIYEYSHYHSTFLRINIF